MTEYDRVYNDVATTLEAQLDEVIFNYEDNLAMKMASEVRKYNPDYCLQDATGPESIKYDKLRKRAIADLTEAMLSILFANETEGLV